MMADVEKVELVVAHDERATLRVGGVFLKIDAEQARTDREVAAMRIAPIPTPAVLWRKPPSRLPRFREGRSAASASRRPRRRRRGLRPSPPHGGSTARPPPRGPVRCLSTP